MYCFFLLACNRFPRILWDLDLDWLTIHTYTYVFYIFWQMIWAFKRTENELNNIDFRYQTDRLLFFFLCCVLVYAHGPWYILMCVCFFACLSSWMLWHRKEAMRFRIKDNFRFFVWSTFGEIGFGEFGNIVWFERDSNLVAYLVWEVVKWARYKFSI